MRKNKLKEMKYSRFTRRRHAAWSAEALAPSRIAHAAAVGLAAFGLATGAALADPLIGGQSTSGGDASGNTVSATPSGASVNGGQPLPGQAAIDGVLGGLSTGPKGADAASPGANGADGVPGGAASNNTVTLNGQSVGISPTFPIVNVIGGMSVGGDGGNAGFALSNGSGGNGGDGGNTIGNSVSITNNSFVRGDVVGGESAGGNGGLGVGAGSSAGNVGSGGSASNNTVRISDSTISTSSVGGGGSVYGGMSTAIVFSAITIGTGDNASGNTVVLDHSAAVHVFGGYGGTANQNRVNITGGGPAGGPTLAIVMGGTGSTANNNSVSVINGTVTQQVIGGFAINLDEPDIPATADGNVVSIGGTTQIGAADDLGLVAGGVAGYSNATASTAPTGNRVIISGSPNLANAVLMGGGTENFSKLPGNNYLKPPIPPDFASGQRNVLELRSAGLSAMGTYGFQEYDFLLPANIRPNATVLTLSGNADALAKQSGQTADLPASTDLSGAKVGVALQSGGAPVLQAGDRVTLLHNANGIKTDPTIAQGDMSGYQGVALQYRFGLSADPDNVYATLEGAPSAQTQASAPLGGRAGALAELRNGSELIGEGIGRAMDATAVRRTQAFGAIYGGSSRFRSQVDVDGSNLLLGVARRFDAPSGPTTGAVFFEAGYGHYGTDGTFDTGRVQGSGDSHYTGGGVLARHDWNATRAGHLYAEGSLHGGRLWGDWGSSDMFNSGGHASWSASTAYYGAHLGVGYLHPFNADNALDLSAKYFWTHVSGTSAVIAGDPFDLSAMNSQLTRIDARFNHALKENLTGYVGVAWEHEFDGTANAGVYGVGIHGASLRGNTGVLEAGLRIKPAATSGFSADVGLEGYVGERRGVAGAVKIRYLF